MNLQKNLGDNTSKNTILTAAAILDLQSHEDDARQVFSELGVSARVMSEHEVAATLSRGGIGIGVWYWY